MPDPASPHDRDRPPVPRIDGDPRHPGSEDRPVGLVPPNLPVGRYELRFRAVERVFCAPMAGAMWRGVLGRALKHMADGLAPVPRGLSAEQARGLYRDLFETPPPPDAAKMRKYTAVPHPYTLLSLDDDRVLQPEEAAVVGLTLVGRANAALPGVVAGFRRAAETGIGVSRGRMALDAVDAVWRRGAEDRQPVHAAGGTVTVPPPEVPSTPPMPRFVEVRIVSALRLTHQGRLAGPDDFRARDLLMFLVRRVSMLSTFHTDTPLDTDFRALKEAAAKVRIVERNLALHRQTRRSSAQGREVPMDGLVGWCVLDLAGQGALWPYLWLAPWIHAGKAATMGLGAVTLHPA